MSNRKRIKLSSDPIEVTSESDPWQYIAQHSAGNVRPLAPDERTATMLLEFYGTTSASTVERRIKRDVAAGLLEECDGIRKNAGGRRCRAWRPAAKIDDEDLLHTCDDCGAELQAVRPGKWQCVSRKCKSKVVK